jgi:hypothetical protein
LSYPHRVSIQVGELAAKIGIHHDNERPIRPATVCCPCLLIGVFRVRLAQRVALTRGIGGRAVVEKARAERPMIVWCGSSERNVAGGRRADPKKVASGRAGEWSPHYHRERETAFTAHWIEDR